MGREFRNPIHIVFGNNDGDPFRIGSNARAYEHIHVHGELFRGEFGGRRFVMNHFDNIGRAIAGSGEFDVACFGHNHLYEVTRIGRTLAINPGPVMGASFAADGRRTDVPCTFVIYDTETDQTTRCEV
jgi:predicted phosphodiesterase